MDLLSGADKLDFIQSMRDAWDTSGKKPIEWVRHTPVVDRFNEGKTTTSTVTLRCMPNYNVVRTWPINFTTDSGENDRQTVQVFFHKEYLNNLGYISSEGYFNYNPDIDRFILDGLTYKPSGDTAASNFDMEDIWVTIILKREETPTGKKR